MRTRELKELESGRQEEVNERERERHPEQKAGEREN